MTARQTIFHVRGGHTGLSAEVASLLPSAMANARQTIKRTRTRSVRTSFCPICGGDKGKRAMRCADCRNRAMHKGKANAARAGYRSSGIAHAARSLIGTAIIAENPYHGDADPQTVTSDRRVRGSGQVRVQAWDRKVMVDGHWVSESQTSEGRERTATDDDAVRRLEKLA